MASSWSLATHFLGFLLLLPIGLRRLLSFYSLYLKPTHTPSLSSLPPFHAKPWYPLSSTNLDLTLLLIALPIASLLDLYLFLTLHRLSFLHHLTLLLFFTLLLLLPHTFPNSLPDSLLFLLASVPFLLSHYLLLHQPNSPPLTATLYTLSAHLSLLCAASCLHLSVSPHSFSAEFMLSSGLIFKSTWLLQTGLNMYTDVFAFKGCKKKVVESDYGVKCDLQEDELRGVALVNLLFVCHAVGVLVISVGLFALLAANRSLRIGDASGSPLLAQLAQLDSAESVLTAWPQFEIDIEID